jgi:hypothetical protein
MKVAMLAVCVLAWMPGVPAWAQERIAPAGPKQRVVLLTDIGNEPDDAESFVRFLLYTNQFDVEALVATTSNWQRDTVQPQMLRERIAAYGRVVGNLRKHAVGYPDAVKLMATVRSGATAFGMKGVGDGKDSEASRKIVDVVDRPDPRPIYIPVWGGAVDLAQALWHVRATRSPAAVDAFVGKLRVYSISDQDDAGPWIRRNFPALRWIVSVHGANQYGLAAWSGISGDLLQPIKWPNHDVVTNQWLAANIRRGPLGALYPPHTIMMEGDTPSFLGMIDNGLNDPERPDWGGWGGRYLPIYDGAAQFGDAIDVYTSAGGRTSVGNRESVFRWRRAFQHDFAARIGWTLSDSYADGNHNPQLVINGNPGTMPLYVTVKGGTVFELNAAGSRDPDGTPLRYHWWQYRELSGALFLQPPAISFATPNDPTTSVTVPKVTRTTLVHVILEVTDEGTPTMTSYRRAVLTLKPCNSG